MAPWGVGRRRALDWGQDPRRVELDRQDPSRVTAAPEAHRETDPSREPAVKEELSAAVRGHEPRRDPCGNSHRLLSCFAQNRSKIRAT